MNPSDNKTVERNAPEQKPKDPARERTNVPGQNPKQDDAPDHDVHHDESRINPLDK
jgi:hypothetical protein